MRIRFIDLIKSQLLQFNHNLVRPIIKTSFCRNIIRLILLVFFVCIFYPGSIDNYAFSDSTRDALNNDELLEKILKELDEDFQETPKKQKDYIFTEDTKFDILYTVAVVCLMGAALGFAMWLESFPPSPE